MALQSCSFFVLFLVLAGAATLSNSEPQPFPISNYDNGHVQSVGKFAVDRYNMRGGPHLYFLQVVNGTVYELTSDVVKRVYVIDIKAINCTHLGTPGLYEAQVFEGAPGLDLHDFKGKN